MGMIKKLKLFAMLENVWFLEPRTIALPFVEKTHVPVEIAQVHLLPVKGLANIRNIRETNIAMMETTIAGVTMTVGIVVVLMSRRNTAKLVNALTQRLSFIC